MLDECCFTSLTRTSHDNYLRLFEQDLNFFLLKALYISHATKITYALILCNTKSGLDYNILPGWNNVVVALDLLQNILELVHQRGLAQHAGVYLADDARAVGEVEGRYALDTVSLARDTLRIKKRRHPIPAPIHK